MEKRLGIIAIIVTGKDGIEEINQLISRFSDFIIARQGIPMPEKNISFITLVINGEMNRINTLTGQLGRLPGVEVRTIVAKNNAQ
jgi:putative iron-only hydrogenase system regulator